MLNPIEHARTKEDALKYKAEPYVVVADIYSHPNLIGRGGWTWYTGSASWYYVAGIKYILGINKTKEYLEINPKFPKIWSNCQVKYKIEDTMYVININIEKNEGNLEIKEKQSQDIQNNNMVIFVDNEKQNCNKIKIIKDGKNHIVEVRIIC